MFAFVGDHMVIEVCKCTVNSRPRWTRDEGPPALICTKCQRPINGYLEHWLKRKKWKERREGKIRDYYMYKY